MVSQNLAITFFVKGKSAIALFINAFQNTIVFFLIYTILSLTYKIDTQLTDSQVVCFIIRLDIRTIIIDFKC